MWWKPEIFKEKQQALEQRAALVRAVRRWFEGQGFTEVETPALQVCPAMDAHIHGFGTDLKGVDLQYDKTLYLHTSPEFAMKKLLVAGMPRIYQLCHVFRNGEGSRLHSPEFTMLEWYRAGADYRDIMEDCKNLLRSVGVETFRHRGHSCDPHGEWEVISVAEAFERYAGMDLTRYLPVPHPDPLPLGEGAEKALSQGEREGTRRSVSEDGEGEGLHLFRAAVSALGLHTAPDDNWDDLFFRVMGQKIEPFLGMKTPAILYDYPVRMASLARRKPQDPRFAERFELYVCGIELANAFGELTDPAEQRRRFHEEMAVKEQRYGERYPVDEDFLSAIDHGLPESGGIALGFDRLAMLAAGADDIEDILWTAKP